MGDAETQRCLAITRECARLEHALKTAPDEEKLQAIRHYFAALHTLDAYALFPELRRPEDILQALQMGAKQ